MEWSGKAALAGAAIILLLYLLPASAAEPYRLGEGVKDPLTTSYISPVKVLWTGGRVENPEVLLQEFDGQVAVNSSAVCVLDNREGQNSSILLDFGKEYQGGIEIAAAIRVQGKPLSVRVCLGESVSEAMSGEGSTATNDHAMRDFIMAVPWLGTARSGESGFRFARIELMDENEVLPLSGVRLVFRYRDIPYYGSFRSSDPRLDEIWRTGAYTVHLNMQNYLWDGIKRDRLVWLGDLHPEVMCVNTVFGSQEVVRKSLGFGRDGTTLPGWINRMCSYSLWWIIIHRDLYLYTGDRNYLEQQHGYLIELVDQVISNIHDGVEHLTGGIRFLDWPTSEMPEVIHAGLQALMLISLQAAGQIGGWLEDGPLEEKCTNAVRELKKHVPFHHGNKQAAALLAIAGLLEPSEAAQVIKENGAEGFSTFFGYYMLEALALAGEYDAAQDIISDYWGAMLDLGATTFWEDLDYSKTVDAGRIDEFVPAGKYDIHADGGAYCYVGLRHSLCHGWAAGPTPWFSRHVLGIEPLSPGMKTVKIKPNFGRLDYVSGSFPTPYGVIEVSHRRLEDGTVETDFSAPEGILVVTD